MYIHSGWSKPFKLQFGYFFINSLTGKQLIYLTKTGLTLISRSGVIPGSLIYDGLRSSFTMGKELGCSVSDVRNLIKSFQVDGHNIRVFPDMSHMIKLARNFCYEEGECLDHQNRKRECFVYSNSYVSYGLLCVLH